MAKHLLIFILLRFFYKTGSIIDGFGTEAGACWHQARHGVICEHSLRCDVNIRTTAQC